MLENGFIPAWAPLAGSLVMVGACIALGAIENRGVIFVGVLPYALYALLYGVLWFDLQPWEASVPWRQDVSRTAFFVQSIWVLVVVLNEYVNQVLSLIFKRPRKQSRDEF